MREHRSVGRPRYIGFSVRALEGPPPDRGELVEALDVAVRTRGLPERRRLTVFDGNLGIVKCTHLEREAMVEALRSIGEVGGRPVQVETLVTSGTIKKVKDLLKMEK